MTSHTPDDEILSALLDAEPVGSDAAHVADCRECQQRLTELRAGARLAATPPAHVAAHVREAAVARAVDAASTDHGEGRIAAITPLGRRQRAKHPAAGRRRVGPLQAAAALVALVVGAGWMLNLTSRDAGTGQTSDSALSKLTGEPADESAFSSAPGPGADATGADDTEAGLGRQTQGAPAVTTPGAPVAGSSSAAAGVHAPIYDGGELGAIDQVEEITRRAESDLAGPRKEGRERACRGSATSSGVILWQASVTYKSTAAVTYRVDEGAGQRVTQVWATSNCSLLVRQAA